MELGASWPHWHDSTICPYPSEINPFLWPSHFWQAQLVSFLVGLRTYQHPGTTRHCVSMKFPVPMEKKSDLAQRWSGHFETRTVQCRLHCSVCWTQNMWFSFSLETLFETAFAVISILQVTRRNACGRSCKRPLFLLEFNHKWKASTDCDKTLRYT